MGIWPDSDSLIIVPSAESGDFQHHSPIATTNHAAVTSGPSRRRLAMPAEMSMTHTTGLGVVSAASRHRVVIGGGGAERQERGSRRVPLLTSPTPGEDASSLACLGRFLATCISRGLRVHRAVQISPLVPFMFFSGFWSRTEYSLPYGGERRGRSSLSEQ